MIIAETKRLLISKFTFVSTMTNLKYKEKIKLIKLKYEKKRRIKTTNEKAIEIHISNSERAWQNIYDEWVAKSFAQLAKLSPALYNKQEVTHDAIQTIH